MAGKALIFPIGHYGGRFFPDVGQALRYHQVRIGWRNHKLDDDGEFTVWGIGHGGAEQPADEPWTREDVRSEAERRGVPQAGATIEALLSRGLLAELQPGREVEFGRTYRLEPLLSGLGNSPQDLAGYHLGLAGFTPQVTLGRVAAELWQFGSDCDHLWAACELLADVARDLGETDPAYADPVQLLQAAFPALRTLLVHTAGYLDLAAGPPQG